MTPQQIEKAVDKILNEELYADDLGIGGLPECKAALLNLITTLQKETWERACEAFRFKAIEAITMINPRFEHEIGAVTDLELPPFNPEK